MQYEASTPKEYINLLDNDWRKDLLFEIRRFILERDSSIIETIEYKMLAFHMSGSTFLHLNAQKNYVGIYVGNISKINHSDDVLKNYDCGKGCVRIKRSNTFGRDLKKLIESVVDMSKRGEDHSC